GWCTTARQSESPRTISRRSTVARTGSNRSAFPPDWWARGAWLLLLVYLLYAASRLELTPARFAAGLEHGAKFLARPVPPAFRRWELLVKGIDRKSTRLNSSHV